MLSFFVGKLLIINIMKSLAAAALSMSLGFAGADAMASEPDHRVANHHDSNHHDVNHVSVGVEGSAHHGAFQGKYLRNVGSCFEAGAALGTGVNAKKDILFEVEGVVACQKEVSHGAGVVLELSAGIEAVRNSIRGVHFGSVVKGTLLGEIEVAKNTKIYAGPYVGVVGGHETQVGGVAGVTVGF